MANRYWVGGTGTWDASNTASWSTSSGGSGGASVPGTSDVAIFDGNSGGGTVTVDSPNGAGVVTVAQIICGAFTGTLDFSANNNDVTLNAGASSTIFSGSGTGTRTINLGSGTWDLTGTGATPWDLGTTTNLTFSGSSADIIINRDAVSVGSFKGGGQSYGSLTVNSNSSRGNLIIEGNNTFGDFSVAAGQTVNWLQGSTQTITNGFTLSGTASLPIAFLSNTGNGGFTLSLGGTCSIDWGIVFAGTKSGAGSLTVTNGLDLGRNSGITITAPSGEGGGGETIIRQKVYGG